MNDARDPRGSRGGVSDRRAPSPAGLLASLRRERADLYAMVLDPVLHPQGLNRLAAHALDRGWPEAAFAFADRRCRIRPVPTARDYLLRAEASRRLGDGAGAAADVRTARDIDPLDPLVNLQALRCLDGAERTEAARMLIASSRAIPAQIAVALAHLESTGARVNARLDASPVELSGWVTWPRDEPLICQIVETHRREIIVSPDAHHPLTTPTRCAATIATPRSPDEGSRVRFAGQSHDGIWEATFEPAAVQRASAQSQQVTLEPLPAVLVVIPVYGDYDATVACLDSLRAQTLPGETVAAVVVDDASPDPRIVAELDTRSARGDFRLIRNPQNRGFAASVNTAVATMPAGEILLLNADTILPPRSLERMLAALRTDPTAGTVTPLSNNGELTSFPVPHSLNPLPETETLLAWDAAAAQVGAPPIDLPNGIGFCMLVRRACWEQLGGISQIYGRGYFEDVDLCLRARDLGFRNLCATNLVVGHAGSRSFQSAKQALVVRNLETINVRFPTQEIETAAYVRAAPLRTIFAEIERHIPPPPHDRLLVAALSGEHPTVRARIRKAADEGHRVLLLTVNADEGPAALTSTLGLVPQSLRFTLASAEERRALGVYLGIAGVRRVEFLDIDRCPRDLFAALMALGYPVDVLVAEARQLEAPDARVAKAVIPGSSPEAIPARRVKEWPWWADRLRAGDRVLSSDGLALGAVRRAFWDTAPPFALDPVLRCVVTQTSLPGCSAPNARLAVLAPTATGAATRLIHALSVRVGCSRPDVQLLVIGTTLGDLSLLAGGLAFVTGPVPDEELARVMEAYGFPALVSPYRDGLFHRLEAASALYSGAVAYFDWSASGYRRREGDLVLDPAVSDASAAERIVDWFSAELDAPPGATTPHHG